KTASGSGASAKGDRRPVAQQRERPAVHPLLDGAERPAVLARQPGRALHGGRQHLALADRDVHDPGGGRLGPAVAAARRHRLVRRRLRQPRLDEHAIGGVNGMWMSTSGRQKNPRSARITRKSWATASIAPAAKQCPWIAATVGTGSAS